MSKSTLHSLTNLKLAQLHTKNLTIVKDALVETVKQLKPYITYNSVQKVLSVIQNELSLVDAHLNQFSKIENTKGEVKEDAES